VTQQSTAIAERPFGTALEEPPIRKIAAVTTLDDLTRFQMQTVIHPVHQYEIPVGKRTKTGVDAEGNDIWEQPKAVMITSDGYDYLNRIMGVELVQPDTVPDEHGELVPNPIHRRDYVYLRLYGIWRNDLGQMVSYREDVEVDFKRVYEDARLNATWYDSDTWVDRDGTVSEVYQRGWRRVRGARHTASECIEFLRDETSGQPIIDDDGNPVYRLVLPNEAEVKALQTLSQLRRFGLRYAFTVAKTRILKAACGIRRLPKDAKQPQTVSVVGWRDLLNPAQRQAQARETARGVWDSAITPGAVGGLSDVEMSELGESEAALDEEQLVGRSNSEPQEDEAGLEAADEAWQGAMGGTEQTKAPFAE
jgi:hypothetical protein